jgi:hypothetical protein
MAAIDSIVGITEISDNLYEVTANITLGAGIDDVNDATFIMKDGGLLKWGSGCSTTFTNCVFHETDTALALGADNYQSYNAGYPPRFYGGTTPVFKGCQWICNTATRSDFDLTPDAAPYFGTDSRGQKTRIIVRNDNYVFAQYNHLASGNMIIDGLIVDQSGSGAAAEFATLPSDPTQWKDLTIVDYEPSNTGRHVTFLLADADEISTVNQLDARNVACWNDSTKTVRLIDPIGRIQKSSEPTAHMGRLEVYRTYGNNLVNAVTGASLNGRVVYYNANNQIVYNKYGAVHNAQLLDYSQDFNTDTVVEEGGYTEVVEVYGYQPQIRTFTIEDTDNPTENIKAVTPLFADNNISNMNIAQVREYASADNADQLYDLSKYATYRSGSPSVLGYEILTAEGSTLNLSDHNLIADPTFDFNIGYTGSSNLAITGTPDISHFVSFGNLGETSTDVNVFSESDFQTYYSAANPYQLNSYVFSEAGDKVFVFGTSSSSDAANVILEYALSTTFDMTTATLTTGHTTGFINGQQGQATITPDGSTIIWGKRWGNWYTISLSTPWDLSTAGATVVVPFTSRRTNVAFNHDGTKLYSTRDANSGTGCWIYEYPLSTPYDVSTAGAEVSFLLPVSTIETGTLFNTQRRFEWLKGGNYAYFNDTAKGLFYILQATTAFDITTLSLYQTLDVGEQSFCAVKDTLNRPVLRFVDSNDTAGVYAAKTYEFHQNLDFNGAPETIYINTTFLAATETYDRIKTTGVVTLQNGASTDMVVQDANGISLLVTATGVVDGSRVALVNVTKDTELDNSLVSGTTYTYSYLGGIVGAVIESGDVLELRVTHVDYLEFDTIVVSTASGGSAVVNQKTDEVYSANAIDGSTVTEFIADAANLQIDLNDTDGYTTVQRIWAWYKHYITTEEGIKTFYKGLIAQDVVNYMVDTDVVGLQVQNIGNNSVQITSGRIYRSDGLNIFAVGNAPISMEYGRTYALETGVSGLTSEESSLLTQAANASGGLTEAQEQRLNITATKADVINASQL